MLLILGSTTLDLIHSGFDQMPTARGDEFTVDSLVFCDAPVEMRFGGNGANSALVAAKLGTPVALGSAIGRDPAGDLLHQPLAAAGVDLRGLLRHPTAATSVTTVLTDAENHRLSFHHAGSSHVYAPADLPVAVRGAAHALLVASFTLFLRWRPQGVADLLQAVKAQGGITALDVGPAVGQPATLVEIAPLLSTVDYFVCNAHELAVCTGVAEDATAIAAGMAEILAAGAGHVLIKLGAAGVMVQQQGWPTPVTVPGFAIDVSSTVGAGDAFNAGLLHALLQGDDVVAAARFANGTAALVLSSPLGVISAPDAAAVYSLLNSA